MVRVSKADIFCQDLVYQTMEMVKVIEDSHKAAQSRQKSYADVRHRDLEFEVGYRVFLKVSPIKGVVWFERRGKLSPLYVVPYEVLRRIGNVA